MAWPLKQRSNTSLSSRTGLIRPISESTFILDLNLYASLLTADRGMHWSRSLRFWIAIFDSPCVLGSREALAKQIIALTFRILKLVNTRRGSSVPVWTRFLWPFRGIYGSCRGIAHGWISTANTIRPRRGTRSSTSGLDLAGRRHDLRSKTQANLLRNWLAFRIWRLDWYC